MSKMSRTGKKAAKAPRATTLLWGLVGGMLPIFAARVAYARVEPILPAHEFPVLGRNFAIGVFALGHVIFPAVALGGPIVAVISEIAALLKRDPRYERFARTVARFTAIVFSVGATFGVVIVVLFAALTPGFWIMGVNLFTWPLVLEGVMFFLEIATLYAYVYLWDRLAEKRGWHLALGTGNILFGTITMLIINGVAAIMLTPPAGLVPVLQSLASGEIQKLPEISLGLAVRLLYFGNPTWMVLNLHRFAANISFIGLLFAAVMAFYALRGKSADRPFYHWATGYSLLWGIGPVFFMPLIGWDYVLTLRDYQQGYGKAISGIYQALTNNPVDPYAPFFNVMVDKIWTFRLLVVFVSAMFILASLYLARGSREGRGTSTVTRLVLLAELVGALLLVINLPGMAEDYLGFALLVAGTAVVAANYWRRTKEMDLARQVPAWACYLVMVVAVMVSYTIGLMGFVREMARYPFLVPGVMRIADMAPRSTAPTGMQTTVGHVLLVITAALVLDTLFILLGLKLTNVPAVTAIVPERGISSGAGASRSVQA